MARKHKHSEVQGVIPNGTEIEVGEIQINLEDQILYSKISTGQVIPVADLASRTSTKKIFLVDVLAVGSGSVGTVKENGEVIEANGDEDTIDLLIYALPAQNFKPTLSVNGFQIPENDLVLQNGYWVVQYRIFNLINQSNTIQITNLDSSETISIEYLRSAAPQLSAVVLENFNYNGSQTAIKEGETATVKVTSDQALTSGRIINVSNQTKNLFKAENVTLIGGETSAGSGIFEYTFTAEAKDINNQLTNQCSFTFAASNQIGSESQPFNSVDDLVGSPQEKTNFLFSDSSLPTINITGINYPANQQAIKSTETADVIWSSNGDSFTFSSPNGGNIDVSVLVGTNSGPSSVSISNSGIYDEAQNFQITVFKNKNGTSESSSVNVRIADIAPEVNKNSGFNSPFRSGGSYNSEPTQNSISISSNQDLLSVEINVESGKGLINNPWSTSNNKNWTNNLFCNDTDQKGTHQFINLSFINQAGIEITQFTNNDSSYEFKGFVSRTFSIGPNANSSNINLIPDSKRNKGPDNNVSTGSGLSSENLYTSQIGTNVWDLNNLSASWTAGGNLNYFNNLTNNTSSDLDGNFVYSYSLVNGLLSPSLNDITAPELNLIEGSCFRLTDGNTPPANITTYTEVTIEEIV